MTTRECVICGKSFQARVNSKTCSPECGYKLKRKRDTPLQKIYLTGYNKTETGKNNHIKHSAANRKKMADYGFVQRVYWVHPDDADALRTFAKMLQIERKKS